MNILHLFSLCGILSSLLVKGEDKPLHLLGLTSLGGLWAGGEGSEVAFEMGLNDVNARPDILPGYKLKVTWEDTQCVLGQGLNNMYKQLYQPPTKIMVIGAVCPDVSEAVALTSQLWNLITLSYVSVASSDASIFKHYLRLNTPVWTLNLAYIETFKAFNWKRVATIHETVEVWSKLTEDLAVRLQQNNMTLITSEIFTHDPSQQIQNLKRHDARVIVVGCFGDKVYQVICEIYKNGLYGPKYVWIMPGYYRDDWWENINLSECSEEEIAEVMEGSFGFWTLASDPKEVRGLAGFTNSKWTRIYEEKMTGLSKVGIEYGPMTYDTAWVVGLALNRTIQQLEERGYNKRLEDFTYEDENITQIIYENMFKLEFQGVKGHVKFTEDGDNLATVVVWRMQDGIPGTVGYYNPYESELEWLPESPIIWKGGKPPADSTTVIYKWTFVDIQAYITMCFFASFGILISIIFGIFNIIFRKERMIKMSSPQMNNVILTGCMITYITVFLQERSTEEVLVFCKIRIYTLMIGFSMAFGALFAKTWRVYVIFMNRTKKVVIRDSHLFLVVSAIVGVDIVILIIREIIDPTSTEIQDIEVLEKDDGNVVITNRSWVCTSQYDIYFKGTIYTIKGLLLLFGAFLAWQTRKVKIPALNDSQYIGVCIYNVAVLSVLGVVLTFALTDQVVLSYILSSCIIIFGTSLTQMIIFIPKMSKFKSGSEVEDEDMATNKTVQFTAYQTSTGANLIQIREDLLKKTRLLQEAEEKITAMKVEMKALKSNSKR